MAGYHTTLVVMLALGMYIYNKTEASYYLPGAIFDPVGHILELNVSSSKHQKLLLGVHFDHENPLLCDAEVDKPESLCLIYPEKAQLNIDHFEDVEENVNCYQVKWTSISPDVNPPLDCFRIEPGQHWYGGGEVKSQRWTIEKKPVKMVEYLSYDVGLIFPRRYGSVIERYWLSSNGVAVSVPDDVPLHVGVNKTDVCFKAQYKKSSYRNPDELLPELKYRVCTGTDVKSIHKYMADRSWQKPVGIPEEDLFKYPIWSTWARYKMAVNQTSVLSYAHEIKDYNFTGCQIEIDDKYTPVYGDWIFDEVKFPQPKQMTDEIHELGMKVTSWIMPFANLRSEALVEGVENGYFVKSIAGVPGFTIWWQGLGLMVDFTNPNASKWFFDAVNKLKDDGIDSFKFDAGEVGFLPLFYSLHNNSIVNPSFFTTNYVDAAYSFTNNRIEVRSAYKNQHLPIMVRMMDKNSDWGLDQGLQTMIPTILHFGIIGYPFVLPDMIGGNAYKDTGFYGDLPEKQLFIRWAQLTAFFPVMQYSIAPWQYDDQTIQICRYYTDLHTNYIAPKILQLAKDSMTTGDPIIRPLWWVDPLDPETYDIETSFLIGDDLLVAPILHENATSRDIYVPNGHWRDMLRGGVVLGRQWLYDYKIALNETAYFEKIHA